MADKGLFGRLGVPMPSRFPYSGRPQAGGATPGQPNQLRARTVTVFGPNGGVFVYSGTPGLGNPPIAWMSNGLVDPFGNSLAASVTVGTSLAGVGWNGMFGGTFYTAAAGQLVSEAAQFGAVNSGEAILTSPLQTLSDNFAIIRLLSRLQNGGTLPGIQLAAPITATAGNEAVPTVITTDAWQNLNLLTGFTQGTRTPQYRRYPDNTIHFRGRVALTANQIAGTSFVASGAWPYTPSITTGYVTSNNLSGYALGVQTWTANGSGSLAIQAAGSTGNTFDLDNCSTALD